MDTTAYDETREKIRTYLLATQLGEAGDMADHIMEIVSEPDDNSECRICHASMEKYTGVRINVVVAKALIKIARAVRLNAKTMPFTEANNVYVSKLPGELELTHAEKTNLNFVRLHGLIAKVTEDGKNKRGYWLVTKRGWAFLRGEEVPCTIDHFRNKVIKTYEDTATISDILRGGEYSNTIETLQRELADLPDDLRPKPKTPTQSTLIDVPIPQPERTYL